MNKLLLILILVLMVSSVNGLTDYVKGTSGACVEFHVIDENGNVNDAVVDVVILQEDTRIESGLANNINNGIYCYDFNTSWDLGFYIAQANVTYTDNNVSAGVTKFKVIEEDTDAAVANAFSFIDLIFIIQFLVFMGILGYNLYNILHKGEKIEIKMVFLLFVGLILTFGVGFSTTLLSIDKLIFYTLFKLQSWFLLLGVLFFIIELILFMSYKSVKPSIAQNSRKEYLEGGRA